MTPRGERRHFISKTCETSENCQKMLYAFTPVCTRNWYDDWTCVECCKGDRCNKFVIVSKMASFGLLF
jgi:lymphocyte antigen 6 complex locus protein D/E/F/G6/H